MSKEKLITHVDGIFIACLKLKPDTFLCVSEKNLRK